MSEQIVTAPNEGDNAFSLLDAGNQAAQQADEALMSREILLEKMSRNRSSPFTQLRVDLAALGSGNPPVNHVGRYYAIHYRREGSAPGGRLDLDINGKLESFFPGATVEVIGDRFSVSRNSRSSVKGLANLLVVTREDGKWHEPADIKGQICEPVDLVGASSSSTFVTIPNDTQPSGTPAASFDATGWSRVRVYLKASVGSITTAQLTPWVKDPTTGLWFPQTTSDAVTPVADAEATGLTNNRVVVFDLDVTGLVYFQLTQNTSGGTVQAIIQGVR